jgi:hypothetical protein
VITNCGHLRTSFRTASFIQARGSRCHSQAKRYRGTSWRDSPVHHSHQAENLM